MKTQTAPALTGKAMYQAMIAKAESDLDLLFLAEKESQRTLAQAQQERESLLARARARADQLLNARTDFEGHQAAVQKQNASIAISVGTSAHSTLVEALWTLEKKLAKAVQHLQDVQASDVKEEQADSHQREVLDATIQRETIALSRIAEKRSSLSDARDRAMNDLGQEEYSEVLALVEVLKNHVAAKQAQVEQAQSELEERIEQGITRLSQWPEQASKVQALVIHQDSTTDLLEAFVSFLDLLIDKGSDVTLDSFFVGRVLHQQFLSLDMLLSLNERSVLNGLRGVDVDVLEERRSQSTAVLEAYRDSKKRGEY